MFTEKEERIQKEKEQGTYKEKVNVREEQGPRLIYKRVGLNLV